MSDRRRDRLKAWVTRKLHSSTPNLPDASAITQSQRTTPAAAPISILPHSGGPPPNKTPADNATSMTAAGPTLPASVTDPAKSQPKSELAVDNLTVTFALVQQVADIVQKIPWIAPAAALMSEMVKVYKVRSNNDSNNTTVRFPIISSALGSQGYK
jgi:hypothetical protein